MQPRDVRGGCRPPFRKISQGSARFLSSSPPLLLLHFVTIVTIHYNCLSCEKLPSVISIEPEEILVLQSGPLSSIDPSAPFPPAASDGARHPNAARSAPAPDYAASRAVLARENETNLQLSKEQLDFLHLIEMNEVSATITEICEFGGVSRPTFYRWRSNPRFAQAFGECIARCVFNDLSIVLRNELQDAMTGDRKAGRHTLKLFLSGRGLQHYDAILSMLNSAGRNTPIPPHAGQSDPNSPVPSPSASAPSVSNAAPSAGAAAPSAGSAPPRAATAAAPSALPATAAAVTAASPAAPAVIAAVALAPPQSPEPIATNAAPINSAPVEPAIAVSPAISAHAASAAISDFATAWAMTLDTIDAAERQRSALNRGENETFASPEKSRPQADQPLPPQQLTGSANPEISFCVSHALAAAADDTKPPREPHLAAVEHAPIVATLAPVAASPAISLFAAAYAKDLGASGAASHKGADSPANETSSPPKSLRAQSPQVTRNPPLTAAISPSLAPKCRIACLASLRSRQRPANPLNRTAGGSAGRSRGRPGRPARARAIMAPPSRSKQACLILLAGRSPT
jgi:hypothetical protein